MKNTHYTIERIAISAPDKPEIDDKVVTAMLFDGWGLAQCSELYILFEYPTIERCEKDKFMKRSINQMRYGYRLPDDFKITFDDSLFCFGTISIISHKTYNSLMSRELKV